MNAFWKPAVASPPISVIAANKIWVLLHLLIYYNTLRTLFAICTGLDIQKLID